MTLSVFIRHFPRVTNPITLPLLIGSVLCPNAGKPVVFSGIPSPQIMEITQTVATKPNVLKLAESAEVQMAQISLGKKQLSDKAVTYQLSHTSSGQV